LLFQLEQYGELSEKQIASIRPAIERDRAQIEQAKIREIERQALIAKGVVAPEGKVTTDSASKKPLLQLVQRY